MQAQIGGGEFRFGKFFPENWQATPCPDDIFVMRICDLRISDADCNPGPQKSGFSNAHVGTAALGRPVERSSTPPRVLAERSRTDTRHPQTATVTEVSVRVTGR